MSFRSRQIGILATFIRNFMGKTFQKSQIWSHCFEASECSSEGELEPVWPDLAKLCHFGKN